MDRMDCAMIKIARMEDPLTEIERSTLSLLNPLHVASSSSSSPQTSSELYKALKQTPGERKRAIPDILAKQGFPDVEKKLRLDIDAVAVVKADKPRFENTQSRVDNIAKPDSKAAMISGMLKSSENADTGNLNHQDKISIDEKANVNKDGDSKNIIISSDMSNNEHQNWLTPSIKLPDTTNTSSTSKNEQMSIVQVMDEETRMSAESNSRSQTPARNISAPGKNNIFLIINFYQLKILCFSIFFIEKL